MGGEEFLQQVLGWDLPTCVDENKIDLQPLPDIFQNATEWATAPLNHILEEFRSTLHQQVDDKGSLENLAVTFEATVVGKKIKCKDEGPLKAVRGMISQDRRNGAAAAHDGGSFGGAEGGVSLHGAIGVFAKGGSKSSSVLGLKAHPHFLCRIRCAPQDDDPAGKKVSVDVVPSLDAVMAFLADVGSGWALYVLDVTTIPVMRMLDALESLQTLDTPAEARKLPAEFRTLIRLMCDPTGGRGQEHVANNAPNKMSVLFAKRNVHQQAAICRAVSMSPRLQIIHGPPGTGKTATLVALIESLLGEEDNRVYASAPTNQAICELAKRCLQGIVLCPGASRCVPTHEMVLVGNASRLVLDDELALVHLDSRAEGIDAAIKAMWQMMQDGTSTAPEIVEGAGPSAGTDVLTRMLKKSTEVATHAMDLANGLPSKYLNDRSRQELSQCAMELARRCECACPSRRDTLEAFAASGPEELVVSLLKFVQNRPGQLPPRGLGVDALKDAVLEGARLVFSTVSTGGRRDMVKLRGNRFNVAIIDEATQVSPYLIPI